jgi:3-mercaptopyruvate sulfurtransferase SseA
LLINTLPSTEQGCLIVTTISAQEEEDMINKYMKVNRTIRIILYGRNSNDESIFKKYQQLSSLGFHNVYVYPGGMFEWLLLQDIYGADEFPTTAKQLDILKYKAPQKLNVRLIANL